MKGYLLKSQQVQNGEETYIESVSSENNYQVIFEDDTDTGYFYAASKNELTGELQILDMLLVYDVAGFRESTTSVTLNIIWSTDWMKCGLILDDYCYAVFDFDRKAGYNRLEFPPPVLWPIQERKLTDKMVAGFFA